jgi:acyl CoA:acetate/3-ketoacid CoA transferase alpha subunit
MNVIEEGLGELIRLPDMEAFREWNRTQKSRQLVDKVMDEHEAVRRFVTDGCYLGTELYGTVRAPMSLTRELIRQKPQNLGVSGQGVLELDMILAAGLVEALDITYIGMEVYGVCNGLRRAVESGQVKRVTDWSNASLSWRLKAAAMGVPFLPVRSMLGSDTLKHSAAKVVEDPFTGIKVCLVPALILDVALIHVHRCDKYGNAQIDGISGFAHETARAAKRLVISTEEIVDTEVIRSQPDRTIIPYYLVDAVVHAPFGSHPGEMVYDYARDEEGIREWVKANETAEGAESYFQKYVYGVPDHQAYVELIGEQRRAELRQKGQSHR